MLKEMKAANVLFNWMEVPKYVCKQSGSWLIYVGFAQLMSNEGDLSTRRFIAGPTLNNSKKKSWIFLEIIT